MDQNPYRPPEQPTEPPKSEPPVGPVLAAVRKVGTAILLVGVCVVAYGAAAFFIDTRLPPNGGPSGGSQAYTCSSLGGALCSSALLCVVCVLARQRSPNRWRQSLAPRRSRVGPTIR